MIGPGKYDDVCTLVRTTTQATGVILIVLGGAKGEGFSAQLPLGLDGTAIARMLRTVAAEIETSYPEGVWRA